MRAWKLTGRDVQCSLNYSYTDACMVLVQIFIFNESQYDVIKAIAMHDLYARYI